MSEQIISACEAVYLSELNPWMNHAHSPVIAAGFSECLAINRPLAKQTCCRAENIGLLQFKAFDLADNVEILKAQLHCFVCRAHCRAKRIQVYPIIEPFDEYTVTWITKPAVQAAPIAGFWVERGNTGHYVTCDITQYVKDIHAGRIPGWGLSLIADRENAEGIVFFSNQAGLPFYICINYRVKPFPPTPGEMVENIFCEHILEVAGTGALLFSGAIEVSRARKITFFIENTGGHSFNFNLQISPDGTHFIDDKQTQRLEAENTMAALTPYLFAKYMRVRIQPVSAGEPVHARIWCQMQTHNYLFK